MKIQRVQKVIKVGSSAAVTVPANDLRSLGVTYGQKLNVTFEPVQPAASPEQVELVALTQKLIKRHQQALNNLSER